MQGKAFTVQSIIILKMKLKYKVNPINGFIANKGNVWRHEERLSVCERSRASGTASVSAVENDRMRFRERVERSLTIVRPCHSLCVGSGGVSRSGRAP